MATVTHPEDGFFGLGDADDNIDVLFIDEFTIDWEFINVYYVGSLAGMVR